MGVPFGGLLGLMLATRDVEATVRVMEKGLAMKILEQVTKVMTREKAKVRALVEFVEFMECTAIKS